jgi:hypothetical protein
MSKERKSLKVQIWEELDARGWVTPLSEPPDNFVLWWKDHDHARHPIPGKGWSSGITAHKAWQCAIYRDEFKVRGHENARGTGVNFTNYGWFRPYQKPMTSNPAILAEHREWCKLHGKPDPLNAG